jgi:Fe2+ or Zn2+ uptake regulation protein
MESLSKVLSSKGVRPTYQRLKVLKYLKENRNHPTVDMIFKSIVKEIPSMSRTTVYNTLKMLVSKGLIINVLITGKEARFDYEMGVHHNFYCEKCGKVIDLNITCAVCDKKEIDGHIIKELHGYFKGLCKNCK